LRKQQKKLLLTQEKCIYYFVGHKGETDRKEEEEEEGMKNDFRNLNSPAFFLLSLSQKYDKKNLNL
jgi:hypothetical protein